MKWWIILAIVGYLIVGLFYAGILAGCGELELDDFGSVAIAAFLWPIVIASIVVLKMLVGLINAGMWAGKKLSTLAKREEGR